MPSQQFVAILCGLRVSETAQGFGAPDARGRTGTLLALRVSKTGEGFGTRPPQNSRRFYVPSGPQSRGRDLARPPQNSRRFNAACGYMHRLSGDDPPERIT